MAEFASKFKINMSTIGNSYPTYFIADIAANHDGDLIRAKELIQMCAEAGASAAKFQHFSADTIVSDKGFREIGNQVSHQSTWKKSVYQMYDDASINFEWTSELKNACELAGIDFFTSPYSYSLVEKVNQFVPAFKIGSGDITWLGIIEKMASYNKPLLLATGASKLDDVIKAVNVISRYHDELCLMQCNTNYTASNENLNYVNLNVLKTYRTMFPDVVLGLSDHTHGDTTVLGAVALGARVIEKHFTDSNKRSGPDHKFSMTPQNWKKMVQRTRELEQALGDGVKKIEDNERETVVLQRRAIRTVKTIKSNHILTKEDLVFLRPCPSDGIPPSFVEDVYGKQLNKELQAGDHIKWSDLS